MNTRSIIVISLLAFLLFLSACKTAPPVDGTAIDGGTADGAADETAEKAVDRVTAVGRLTGRAIGSTVMEERFRAHPVAQCIFLCQQAKERGTDLSAGPCLSDRQPFVENWVCDVAHHPRQPADNLPENQCAAYREGRAAHFIEVDKDCNYIVRR